MPLALLRKAKFAAKIQQSFDKSTIKQRKNFHFGYKKTLDNRKTSKMAAHKHQCRREKGGFFHRSSAGQRWNCNAPVLQRRSGGKIPSIWIFVALVR